MKSNFTNPSNFQSLEVVGRGSETQREVTENLNWIAQNSVVNNYNYFFPLDWWIHPNTQEFHFILILSLKCYVK